MTAVAIEVVVVKSFSIYSLMIIILGQFFFSKYVNAKTELEITYKPWALLSLTLPFSVFYDSFTLDNYFLVMNTISGFLVGFTLSSFCFSLSRIFSYHENEYLATEAKMIGKCLFGLPLVFIIIMIYLVISVRGGMQAILSIGDLVLVNVFPLIMMIGSVFPAILVGRALKIFYRRNQND